MLNFHFSTLSSTRQIEATSWDSSATINGMSANFGESGISVSADGSVSCGIVVNKPEVVAWFGLSPQFLVQASAEFNWCGGPWGYPSGPESYEVHVLVSAGGSVVNSCEADTAGGSGSTGEASTSIGYPAFGGEQQSDSYYALVNGAASSSPAGVEQYEFVGPDGYSEGGVTFGTNPAGFGYGSGAGDASYGVSLDDYEINGTGGAPPDIFLNAEVFGDAEGSVTTTTIQDEEGNTYYGHASADASATASGSVSLTLSVVY